MNIFGWFGKAKKTFTKHATEVTHRAVAHRGSQKSLKGVSSADFLQDLSVDQSEDNVSFSRSFWVTGLVVFLVAFMARTTSELLLLIVLGYIFSVGLEGPIRFAQKICKNRGFAIFLVYFLLILFCLSMLLIIPFVATQLVQMVQSIISVVNAISLEITTSGFHSFVETTQYIPDWLRDRALSMSNDQDFVASVNDVLINFSQTVGDYLSMGLAGDGFTRIGKFFGSSVMTGRQISLVLILSVFFSIDYKDTFVFLVNLAPKQYRSSTYAKMLIIYKKLQLWLKGQLFLMVYIFTVSLLGMWVLRLFGFEIPNILMLALIAGTTEFLPYIGPMLGAFPAVLVALVAGGWPAALAVMILFFIIQRTENNIVVPVVMNKVLGVRSLIIFVVMLLASSLFGFVGVVMAAPLAVIVTTFWSDETDPLE